MNASSAFGGQSSIQYMVDQFMQFEQGPKNRLLDRKKNVNGSLEVLSELNSKLSALRSRTKRMTDELTDYFAAKKSTVSNDDLLKVTANSGAALGTHTLSVDRLASSDTRISNQFTSSGSDFGTYTTDQTFEIEVAHPTDEDSDNRATISVTVAASVFSGDNDSVMKGISDAVNSAMTQAVADDIITNDEKVISSVVHEESGTTRLQFRSTKTGYSNRMDFGASALLSDLNINNSALASGTTGGTMTTVGTSNSTSELNSKFNLDGLDFYRDSNTVTDAVDGVTLKLFNTFTSQESFSVNTDTEKVRGEIDEFIKSYNEAIKYVRKSTQYGNGSTQGALSNDLTYRNISVDLRDIAQGEVSDVTYSEYNLLYDIGIEADQQGNLSVKDSKKLEEAIETNSEYVSDLFNGSDGIATRMDDYLEKIVKTGGSISTSKKNLNKEITSLNDRLKTVESLLKQKEKQLFEEFSSLQETMFTLQNQQSFFGLFVGQGN